MSLILDALRKMELERKAKRHGSPEIRAEVLNYRGKPQRSGEVPAVAGYCRAAAYFCGNGNFSLR